MNALRKKTDSIITRNFFWRRGRAAFTLLELLVTIAITGILTAIIFSNFANERFRNNLKAAVRQVQVDLQAMQTNAQGGVVLPNTSTVPNGYGLFVESNSNSYTLFADTGGSASRYDSGTDILLQNRTLPGAGDITITLSSTPLNIVYKKPNGTATINTSSTSETIYLKSARLKTCYAITVTAGVGTVSSRQLTSFASCP